MRKFIVPALSAFTLAVASPAAAEEASVVVPYEDLDLLGPAGVEQLDSRIRRAIKQVCGEPDRRNLKLAQFWKECRDQSLQEANTQVAQAVERKRMLALAAMLRKDPRG